MKKKAENPKPGYYAVLPASVRYDNSVPPLGRLLYAEITALCGKEGYCWAKDEYFAGLFDVDLSTIRRLLACLRAKNYIRSEIVSAKTGIERHLFVSDAMPSKMPKRKANGQEHPLKNESTPPLKNKRLSQKRAGGNLKNKRGVILKISPPPTILYDHTNMINLTGNNNDEESEPKIESEPTPEVVASSSLPSQDEINALKEEFQPLSSEPITAKKIVRMLQDYPEQLPTVNDLRLLFTYAKDRQARSLLGYANQCLTKGWHPKDCQARAVSGGGWMDMLSNAVEELARLEQQGAFARGAFL